MIISLIGTHGTGKTKTLEEIKKQKPDWKYFSEGIRHQIPAFGYKIPYDIIEEVGVGAFEFMIMNYWSVIDKKVNSLINDDDIIVTDRSVLDNMAYYFAMRETKDDMKFENVLMSMAKHYADLIDEFVYFPPHVLPLSGDEMRPDDKDFQVKIDDSLKDVIKQLNIPSNKVYNLTEVELEKRAEEIIELV